MVKVRKDLTGQKFGRLKVLYQIDDYIKPNGKHEARWHCICDCEEHNEVDVLGTHLKNGHTCSCGCYAKEVQRQNGLLTKNLILKEKQYNTYNLTGEYGVGYTTKGEEFYFDLEDYDKIKDYCWCISTNGYVVSNGITMHRLVMNPPLGMYVDHIRHKKYDNRKSELRIVTPTQNEINKVMQSNNTSNITGVSFHKASGLWFGYIKYQGKQVRKYANSKKQAIKFRKELEEEYFGQYSYNNSMKG